MRPGASRSGATTYGGHRAAVRRGALLAGAAALVLLAGCGSGAAPAAPVAPAAAPAATVPPPQMAVPPTAPPKAVAALTASAPVGLVVPAIGVRTSPLMGLGLDRDGALEVPPDASSAGWYELGPTPGATGPAVIAAHVDFAGVPGVFVRLRDLKPGDEVDVRRADGSTAVFTTYRVEHHPKSAFPTKDVYGDTPGPELRLITCGGSFDRSTGQYRDNVVAYARMTGSR